MRIAMIGNGNMGQALGRLAEQAGHVVAFGSRDPARPVRAAIDGADAVILAVPYAAALELSANSDVTRALKGKIVIDITNPLSADFMSLTVGHSSSAAEEIAARLPGACVVKAFNTVFADVLCQRADGADAAATVFVAGDDGDSKRQVIGLAGSFGFEAIDAGALSNARYLEPITELMIQLAYGQGLGTEIAFELLRPTLSQARAA